jgi:PAS domain S-box-containing protein
MAQVEEIKLLQKRINEARVYAESIIETMREILIVLDDDLRVISVNSSFYRTFKVTPKETKGRFIYDLGNRQWDIPKLRQLLEEILPKNNVFENYEIEHSFETIGLKTMLLNARRLDTTRMILLAIEDITERKHAGDAVRELNQQIEFILGATKTGLDIIDPDFNLRYVDSEWQKVYGTPASRKCYEYFMDKNEQCFDCGAAKALETKKTIVSENILARESNRPIQVTSIPFQDKDGNWLVAEVNVDITVRKKVEDALRVSERKIRAIFDQTFQFIGMLALDGTLIEVNRTAMQFRGINESDCLGKPFWDTPWWTHSPEMQKRLREAVRKAVNGEVVCFEATHPAADGSIHYVDFSLKPVRDETGKVIFLIPEGRDITERKRMEEEVRYADELKIATEIKSKFTSMVSHELRSPLAAIKEGINLVLEGLVGSITEEQRDLLDTAKKNTDRLGRLINDVLDFQKIDSGKMEFDIRENDINEVAREVGKEMSLLAGKKGLNLVVDVDDDLPKIRFDKDKIIQVITNLLNNAINFTEKGSISISTKRENNAVHVTVKDTGQGIESEDIERLFQAFGQLDARRNKKKGGTGLGLAISKEIILAHRGKIWAESETGKGTVLHFTLPLKERRG